MASRERIGKEKKGRAELAGFSVASVDFKSQSKDGLMWTKQTFDQNTTTKSFFMGT